MNIISLSTPLKLLFLLNFLTFFSLADPSFFSIKTTLSPEAFKLMECNFLNDKWKPLSIKQSDHLILKIHGDVLEEYKETLKMFEASNNELVIPIEFNKISIEIIVKYLYFKEISEIPLNEVISLLKVAFFMKLDPVIREIGDYLRSQINSSEKSLFIFKESFDVWALFPEISLNIIGKIIGDSLAFLIKNNKYEDIMNCLKNEGILQKLVTSKLIEKVFNFFIGEFRKIQANNIVIIEFLVLFKDPLVQFFKETEKSFSIEDYYRKIIENNWDIWDLDVKNVEDFLIKSQIYEGFEMKEFLITVMGLNIKENTKRILELKGIIQKLEARIQMLEKTFDQNFIKRVPIENCLSYSDMSICLKCEDNHILSYTKKNCSREIKYCLEYSEEGGCLRCDEGRELGEIENNIVCLERMPIANNSNETLDQAGNKPIFAIFGVFSIVFFLCVI
jgi:hypothetical protein